MGHSMAEIDHDYMEIIEQMIKPIRWYISTYDDNPDNSIMAQYTFANKVEYYNLWEYLSHQ